MHIHNIQRLALCTAGFTTFIGLVLLSLSFSSSNNYPDFIAGNITWTKGEKFQDLIAMPFAILGTAIFLVILFNFFSKINNSICEEHSQNCALYIVFWTIPALATICASIQTNNFDTVTFGISVTGVFFLLLSYMTAFKRSRNIDAEAISIGLVGIFFLGLIPLDAAILMKFFPDFFPKIDGISEKDLTIFCLTFLMLLSCGYLVFLYLKENISYKEISIIIFLGQLTLPLLYISLYPAKMRDPIGNIHSYGTGIGLKLIIIGLILAALIDTIYRYAKYARKGGFSVKSLSPLAICALLVTLKAGTTSVPTLSADDYHFGEYLLGGWVYLQGYVPYVDYTPAHGIINNDISGLVNFFLYDGTSASFAEAQRFTIYLLSIAAFLSIYYFTGSVLWAFFSVFFLGARLSWLYFIPFIALWLSRPLIENRIRWSIIWLATAPLVILGVPPQGLLLVVASSLIPLYFLSHTVINKDWQILKPIAFSAIIIIIFYLITPLGEMTYHAIEYVLTNGPINQSAYGIPWALSFNPSGVLSEAIRMSWVLVPFFSILFLFFLYKQKRLQEFLVLPLCVVIVFSFLLTPYSMGRIDPGSVSRPGIIGILLIAGIMGFAFWYIFNRYSRIWLFIGLVIFSSLLKFAYVSHQPLISLSVSSIQIGHVVRTQDTDLKNIGTASMDATHWNRINKLNTLIDEKLHPKESYLDLTSRNAQYFYLNRKPIIPVTAPYNIVSRKQQLEAISILKGNLPRLSLLEGDNIVHDGGGLSIRSHYLYRFIIEQYEPFDDNGFVIGLSKISITNGDWGNISTPNNETKMALFEKSFSHFKMNLEKLPASWGKSIGTLEKNMVAVSDLTSIKPVLNDVDVTDENIFFVKGGDPYTWYDLSNISLAGKSAGLLKFDFECIAKHQSPVLQIFWWGDEQAGAFEEASILLSGSNGTLIVPLDASPRWLLLDHIKGIRIDLSNPEACTSYRIKNLSLHQRKLVNL